MSQSSVLDFVTAKAPLLSEGSRRPPGSSVTMPALIIFRMADRHSVMATLKYPLGPGLPSGISGCSHAALNSGSKKSPMFTWAAVSGMPSRFATKGMATAERMLG